MVTSTSFGVARLRHLTAIPLVLFCALSCSPEQRVFDRGGRSGQGEGGSAGSTSTGSCDPTTPCSSAPGGWDGPVVLVTGTQDDPPNCPAVAPTTNFTAFSGLSIDDPTCGCDCEDVPASALTCGNVEVGQSSGSTTVCAEPISSVRGVAVWGQCTDMDAVLSSPGGPPLWWLVGSSEFGATAECAPQDTANFPEPRWDATHVACDLPADCDGGGACVPELGAGQRLCVYIDGEVDCPGAFPERLSTASGVEDTRSCSACTCGPVTGTCTGTITLHDGGCNGGLPQEEIELGVDTCNAAQSHSMQSMRVNADIVPSGGSCEPSTSTPQGAAVELGIRTICCAE